MSIRFQIGLEIEIWVREREREREREQSGAVLLGVIIAPKDGERRIYNDNTYFDCQKKLLLGVLHIQPSRRF